MWGISLAGGGVREGRKKMIYRSEGVTMGERGGG